jgi:predicted amidophosphoribosyltransferase
VKPCPECGQPVETDAVICMNCGHALANGIVPPAASAGKKPPQEVSGWDIEKTPPEMIEKLLGTFNQEEFLAEIREIEKTGGVRFEDFIGEIEEIVKRRE